MTESADEFLAEYRQFGAATLDLAFIKRAVCCLPCSENRGSDSSRLFNLRKFGEFLRGFRRGRVLKICVQPSAGSQARAWDANAVANTEPPLSVRKLCWTW